MKLRPGEPCTQKASSTKLVVHAKRPNAVWAVGLLQSSALRASRTGRTSGDGSERVWGLVGVWAIFFFTLACAKGTWDFCVTRVGECINCNVALSYCWLPLAIVGFRKPLQGCPLASGLRRLAFAFGLFLLLFCASCSDDIAQCYIEQLILDSSVRV